MPEKVHAFHRLKENAILFAVINLKSAITAIFFIFVLGAGAAYGFFRYSENLVQVHNSSVFSISIDKPRVALQMWRRKLFPRPLKIVLTAKPNSPHNSAFATVTDYSFFENQEGFEFTILVNQVTILKYDQAIRDEIAASIQDNFRTMLFPNTNKDYLQVEL